MKAKKIAFNCQVNDHLHLKREQECELLYFIDKPIFKTMQITIKLLETFDLSK